MGFGPVVVAGYGIAYGINKDALYFGISNFVGGSGGGFGGVGGEKNVAKEGTTTDSGRFRMELFRALREVRGIFAEEEEL